MKFANYGVFGEKGAIKAVKTKESNPTYFIPFVSRFASCRICDRTRNPYSKYLPKHDLNPSHRQNTGYKGFGFRFDILVYAASRYPYSFGRITVMQNVEVSDRTGQRVLQSLVREGFLTKESHLNSIEIRYRFNPNKFALLKKVMNKPQSNIDYRATEYLPIVNVVKLKGIRESNMIYQMTTYQFDFFLELMIFAAACNRDGFKRKDVMLMVNGLTERTEQRIMGNLINDGFLIRGKRRGSVSGVYHFNKSKFSDLKHLLNKIDVERFTRISNENS